jgi:hypothetical protein
MPAQWQQLLQAKTFGEFKIKHLNVVEKYYRMIVESLTQVNSSGEMRRITSFLFLGSQGKVNW